MTPSLPPPDPFESLGLEPPGEARMQAPAAVYVGGAPTPETERLATRLLDLRPGALIVVGASVARTEPPATEPG